MLTTVGLYFSLISPKKYVVGVALEVRGNWVVQPLHYTNTDISPVSFAKVDASCLPNTLRYSPSSTGKQQEQHIRPVRNKGR
jgi:hypothetical protein